MKKYDQKITISLTVEDKERLEQLAEADRRTTQQMASIFVEDAIAEAYKGTETANVNTLSQAA